MQIYPGITMGMFDEITVKISLPDLQAIGEFANKDLSAHVWQTKSLINCMSHYLIDTDGSLRIRKSIAHYNNRPGKSWEWVPSDFYGILVFYDMFFGTKQDLWLEFKAKIDDGKLVSLSLLEQRLTSNAKRMADSKILACTMKRQLTRQTKFWYKPYLYLWQIPVIAVFRLFRRTVQRLSTFSLKLERWLLP
jgi:hypothetical protein